MKKMCPTWRHNYKHVTDLPLKPWDRHDSVRYLAECTRCGSHKVITFSLDDTTLIEELR